MIKSYILQSIILFTKGCARKKFSVKKILPAGIWAHMLSGIFMMRLSAPILCCVCCLSAAKTFSADVTQWRGNERNGIYNESGLLKEWPEDGPRLLWHAEGIGLGYSGPAVVGDNIFITGTTDDKKREFLTVLNRKGETLWSVEYGNAWPKSYQDSRTMPTVVGDSVYVASGEGQIACVDSKTRKIKWSVDAIKEFGGDPQPFGYSENLLVENGKVFFTPGGKKTAVVALDAETGGTVWQSAALGVPSSFLSPIAGDFEGRRMLFAAVDSNFLGVDAETGEILWKVFLERFDEIGNPPKDFWDTMTSSPIYRDGKVFVANGYNCGAVQIAVSKGGRGAEIAWKNPKFDMHHGGVVLLGGKLYGSNWINNEKGTWMCVDWNTGETLYDEAWPRHQKGAIVYADGMFYILEESRGEIAISKPGDKFEITSSAKLRHGKGRNWCHPVICDGVMYVRRGKSLTAYDVKNNR